jgi:exonuclease SbcD
MLTFVHAADIHLDSPMRGLLSYEGAPLVEEIRGATRQALDNLVNFILSEKVQLLTIAGDLYDGDWQDFNTGLYFAKQMRKLGEAGVRVAIVRGNHDAANNMTRNLVMPDNVKTFNTRKPETWLIDDLGVALHGQSYARRDVFENLADAYPDPVPDMLNIGILHCLISGTAGHQPYAPCNATDLAAKGYDYWALGHVHEFRVIQERPSIVYSGCIQGRHIREPGAKGCVLVEADRDYLKTEFVSLDVLRWGEIVADVSDADNIEQAAIIFGEALGLAMPNFEGRPFCVRAVMRGRCAAHGQMSSDPAALTANVRAVASDVSSNQAWIEKVKLRTGPVIDFDDLAVSDTPQGELLRFLEELSSNPQTFEELGLDLTEIKAKLSGSGVEIPEDELNVLLSEVRDILLTLLSNEDS